MNCFEAVKDKELPTVEGEFISSSVSKIHRSIYSSRYDHKYLNDKVERRMLYQAEPLMVMAETYDIPYKKGLLDRIWKLLNKIRRMIRLADAIVTQLIKSFWSVLSKPISCPIL